MLYSRLGCLFLSLLDNFLFFNLFFLFRFFLFLFFFFLLFFFFPHFVFTFFSRTAVIIDALAVCLRLAKDFHACCHAPYVARWMDLGTLCGVHELLVELIYSLDLRSDKVKFLTFNLESFPARYYSIKLSRSVKFRLVLKSLKFFVFFSLSFFTLAWRWRVFGFVTIFFFLVFFFFFVLFLIRSSSFYFCARGLSWWWLFPMEYKWILIYSSSSSSFSSEEPWAFTGFDAIYACSC